jgi:hypothetical protein
MALDQPGSGEQVGGGHRVVGLAAAAEWRAPVEISQDLGQVLVIGVWQLLFERLCLTAPCPVVHHLIVAACN